MNAKDCVDRLDKLNKLKKEGIIDENEYEAQVNEIKRLYLNKSKNVENRESINAIVSLIIIVGLIIVAIWFFYTGAIN